MLATIYTILSIIVTCILVISIVLFVLGIILSTIFALDNIYHIRKVKSNHGIILNPLKIAFLVHASKYNYIQRFDIIDVIFCAFGPFIFQFIVPRIKEKKKKKFSKQFYWKLYNKYVKE